MFLNYKKRCVMIEFVEFKAIIVSTFTWALATLALDGSILGILIFLLLLDATTGFLKALVMKKATSRVLIYGIGKKLTIVLIPITLSAGAIIIGRDITALIDWAYSLLALGEVYSIIGNVVTINTRKEVVEFDALLILISKLNSIFAIKAKKDD